MKVLVANKPQLLRECLGLAIATEPGYEVGTEVPVDAAILRSARRFRADCVIVTLDNPERQPRICSVLLARCPEAHIVAVGRRTLTTFWFEEGIRSSRIEYSLDAILAFLRKKESRFRLARSGTQAASPLQQRAV